GSGLAAAVVVAHLQRAQHRAADERDTRFQRLLSIAVDTYWELDAEFRTTVVWRRGDDGRFARLARSYPAPWNMPEWVTDPATKQAHEAACRAHLPLRHQHIQWRRCAGGLRHALVSGEPRFDAEGRFLGYWGVSRDITANVQLE